jgi:hypothetical protein
LTAEGIEATFKQSDDLRPAFSGRENAAVESLQSLGSDFSWDSLGILGLLGVRIRGFLGIVEGIFGANPWNEIL